MPASPWRTPNTASISKRGDEVLTTNQDYPRMIETFRQRERREGIVLKTISFPVPPPSHGRSVSAASSAP